MLSKSILLLLPCLAVAAPARSPFADIFFEPNLGQSPAAVRYFARAPQTAFAFRDDGIEIAAGDRAVRLRFAGAQPNAVWEALDTAAGQTSYFLGGKSVPNVPHYGRLAWRGIYPGIDAIFYGAGGRLEYDLVVAPGADASQVRIRFDGATRVSSNPAGDLLVATGGADLTMHLPRVYQRRGGEEHAVDARYIVDGSREVRFAIGSYDRGRELIVDPILTVANYYSGERDEAVTAVTSQGDYIGTTSSSAFGDGRRRNSTDVFALVTPQQFSPGQTLYVFGGSGDDVATSAVSISDGVAVGGWTDSPDFGTPPKGGKDAFLICIPRRVNNFPQAVFRFGGRGDDRVHALASAGSQFYFAGDTNSPDLTLNGQPLSTRHAGGMDAMFGLATIAGLSQLAYYGGSGDDSAYAIAQDITIGGKTTSPDLPLKDAVFGQLSGPSDGFIARFDNSGLRGESGPFFATYVGGSGEDEIRGLVSISGAGIRLVAFAGTTTSTDLPVPNAAQPQYGGGESDAFAGRIDVNARTLVRNTYIGGSGRDEASAIGVNGVAGASIGRSDDLIAGSTTSADLPVKAAFQERLGGPQDAWYGALSAEGKLESLSYFGGSGSERVLAMMVTTDNLLTLAGETDSPDLPMPSPNSTPTVPLGGKEGFLAQLVVPRLELDAPLGIWAGRNVRTFYTAYLSAAVPDTARVTLTSSDASKVLVGHPGGDMATSFSVPFRAIRSSSAYLYFQFAGLVDSGEAEVTLEVEGAGSRKLMVRLGPARVHPGYPTLPAFFPGQQAWINPQAGVLAEGDRFVRGAWDPDVPRPTVTYSGSNDAVATVTSDPVPLSDDQVPYRVALNAVAPGEVTITMSSPNVEIFGSASVTYTLAVPRITLPDFALAKDTQNFYALRREFSIGSDLATVTSDSPEKVCLAPSNTSAECAASVTYPDTLIYVRALSDSGTATLRIASPRYGGGSTTVQLSTAKLMFYTGNSSTLNLTEGNTFNLAVQVGTPLDPSRFAQFRPGMTPDITVTSSDPKVVSVTRGAFPTAFVLTPLAPGRVTLTARGPGFGDAEPYEVVVNPRQLKFSSVPDRVPLGRNLQTSVATAVSGVAQRARSSAPDLVAISTDPNRPGAAEAEISSGSFWLQAVGGEGTATVTLSAPGYDDKQVTVQVFPSGFAWRTPTLTLTTFSTATASYSPHVLDPDTMAPIAVQARRPGISIESGTPTVINTNPEVGEFLAATSAFRARAPGSTTLWLEQPNGFSKPGLRNDLRVVVNPAAVTINIPSFVGKDLQTSITIEPTVDGRVTVRSADPSRLVLSADRTTVGRGEITVTRSAPRPYLQGLAGEGIVDLTISGEGFREYVVPVTLVPAGVLLYSNFSTYRPPIELTTQSDDYPVSVRLFAAAPIWPYVGEWMLRAGIPALEIPVVSAQPQIARPTNSPLTFAPGDPASATFRIRPGETGTTTIRLAPPAGFQSSPRNDQVEVVVRRPAFQSQKISVGRDLSKEIDFRLREAITGPDTILLTLVSSDPSRVLLASDLNQPGQPRLVVPFNRSSNQARAYVYGLAEGAAAVTVSATGFEDTRHDVAVSLPDLALREVTDVFVGQRKDLTVALGRTVRPGARFVVHLRSSDPAIATVTSPVVIEAGSAQAAAQITPLAEGRVTISVEGGEYAPVSVLSRTMNVVYQPLPLYSFAAAHALGKNLWTTMTDQITAQGPLAMTIRSSDPSKVLLSTDAKGPGQASITLSMEYYQRRTYYMLGMSDSGTATVTYSAPGYESKVSTVSLYPAKFVFDRETQNVSRTGSFEFGVVPRPAAPPSATIFPQSLVTGVTVAVVSSQPAVGTVRPSPAALNAGDTRGSLTFTPASPGVTILTITPPSGFEAGNPPSQMIVTVN